jgi:hypothetical protein
MNLNLCHKCSEFVEHFKNYLHDSQTVESYCYVYSDSFDKLSNRIIMTKYIQSNNTFNTSYHNFKIPPECPYILEHLMNPQ